MLASENRLKEKNDYERVKKGGKLLQAEGFAISFIKRENEDRPRFGFVVSTKICKHSTLRNRIKRALSEAVRFNLKNIDGGIDAVFLAKKTIAKKTTDEIMKEVEAVLKKYFFTK